MDSEQYVTGEARASAPEARGAQTGWVAAAAGWVIGSLLVAALLWIEPPAGLLAGLMGLTLVWLRRHRVPLEHAAGKAHYVRATDASAQSQGRSTSRR